MNAREPLLHTTLILELRPTQMTLGLIEVEAKRQAWREKHGVKAREYLGQHMIPVLKGPKDRLFLIDHHHLARALHEEGVESVLVTVVTDLSKLDKDCFWTVCDHHGWAHPYDAKGVRRSFDDIPKRIDLLEDDPFRSLAGQLRRAGGFAKDVTPFSEFLWADFLRRKLSRRAIVADFEKATVKAMALARSEKASYLPGWSGPIAD